MARLGGEGAFIVREFIQPGSVLVVQGGLAYAEAAPKGAPTLKTQSSRRRLGPITQAFRKRGSTCLNWLGKMQDVFPSRSRQQRSSILSWHNASQTPLMATFSRYWKETPE